MEALETRQWTQEWSAATPFRCVEGGMFLVNASLHGCGGGGSNDFPTAATGR